MKATLTQENFAKALNYVSKAISSNPSIPILANVLIETTDSQLKLSSTDLEIGVSTLIGADVKSKGKITANARMLADFVTSLSSGKLDIEMKEKVLLVKNASNSAEFNVIDAEEFPPLPLIDGSPSFTVNAIAFIKSINQVVFSSASDDSRPVLTGVLFEADQNNLSMVGVDGFRLSKKRLSIKRKGTKSLKQIVPARALNELARIAGDICEDKDKIEAYLLSGKNQFLFKAKDVELSTRLIEGEFPDYQQILPKDVSFSFGVDKEALAQTVKIVSIFARSAVGNKAVFELNPSKNALSLSAQVADVGENESTVEVHDVKGEILKTSFNTRFLADMINSLDGEEIIFESNGVTAPGVFKDKDDKNFLHIIMPMRLD